MTSPYIEYFVFNLRSFVVATIQRYVRTFGSKIVRSQHGGWILKRVPTTIIYERFTIHDRFNLRFMW